MELVIVTICIICIMILVYGSTYINILEKNKLINLSKDLKKVVGKPGKAVINAELSVTILEFIISGIVVEKYGMPLILSLSTKLSNFTYNSIKYIAIIIVTIIATYITMIFGTYIPKHLVLSRRRKKINKTAIYLYFVVSSFLSPLSFIANILDESMYVKSKDKEDNLYKEDEIKQFTNVEYHKGNINKTEKEIIENVAISFDSKIDKIYTKMEDVAYIKEGQKIENVIKVFKKSTYSRLIVYNKKKTKIIGALYVKDTLNNYDKLVSGKLDMLSILRTPLEVSCEDSAYKVYMKMRKNRMHLAVVFGENKNPVGIITIDDVLVRILGKIEDEYEHDD